MRKKLFVGALIFSLGFLFVLWKSSFAQISLTKLRLQLLPQEKEKTLASLNMLFVAKEEKELAFWLAVFGPQVLMDDLLSDAGEGSTLDCHQEAHRIGRASYELYGSTVFAKRSELCHSGFLHGAMEAFLQEKGTENLAKNMAELCNTFETGFGKFECYHGVGHGVLAYEDYDLPVALSLCKKMPDSSSKSSCFGGVFMENVMTSDGKGASPIHRTTWVSNDPHFPCSYFKDDYELAFNCYQMQTSRMLIMYHSDFDRVLVECLNVPDNLKKACFRSLGRDAAGIALRDPQEMVAFCGKIPESKEFVDECIIGALNVIVDFWGENLKEQASDFCKALPTDRKTTCYSALAKRLPGLFTKKEKQREICLTFEPQFVGLCTSVGVL